MYWFHWDDAPEGGEKRMGMDVYGRRPTSKTGEYFRNNVWYWHPLASFIQSRYADEIPKIKQLAWHSNDGDGLGANDSVKLAHLMQDDLNSGFVAQYAQAYEQERNEAPKVECTYRNCNGTGWNILDVQSGIKEKCPQCDGTGWTDSLENCYPFSEENVREFVAFLVDSGGFKIW
jgi:hypothetical protein